MLDWLRRIRRGPESATLIAEDAWRAAEATDERADEIAHELDEEAHMAWMRATSSSSSHRDPRP